MEPTSRKENSSDKLHILDYWRIIRVRIVTILLVFLLTAITTTVVTFLIPKTYMSLSRIAVEKDTSDIAPLLGMLNSCASGITVVNIDNGFGAACAAHRILNQIQK